MQQKNVTVNYREYESIEELPLPDKSLLQEAINATASSYAPYSNFNVGAAVRMSNGEIVTGSNQENAASPSGLCAERVAIFAAHHQYPSQAIEAIAVVGKQDGKITSELTFPCAACIQVILESQKRSGKPLQIIVGSSGRIQVFSSVNDLLPFSFTEIP